MVSITLPDGTKKDVKDGSSVLEFVLEHIGEGLARAAVAAKFNDEVIDLTTPLTTDGNLSILTFKDDEGKEVYWHSTAHICAIAVQRLFPETKLTIGPPIEEGFYYDFYRETPFTDEDIEKIQAEMKKIIKENLPFKRVAWTYADAKKELADNKFKLEILEEYKDSSLTAYTTGDNFVDMCRGPHVPSTGKIKAVKLTKHSAAYWRGDAKKESLQRIYGISYPSKDDLKEYVTRMEEAAKRNHRVLGERHELYILFDKIGKGLPVWLPKGEIVKSEIEKYAKEVEEAYGYVRVSTPVLAKKELFETSGHLPYYKDDMYPSMKMDDGEYYLKAMNCPGHHLIFSHKKRSYKELPLRIAEYGLCHRNEMSGALSGLQRVRAMCMNDAHIYCRKDQIEDEIKSTIQMIKDYYKTFGLEDYWFRLSLSDLSARDKYIDQPENWAYTEEILRNVLVELDVKFVEVKDEAAFYGPKIDIQFRNVYGKEDSMSTVQLDFIAKERFGLEYTDESNKANNEVFVIHRAPLSTHERFMAFLIEHTAARFPLWLSPVQVKVLPIADRHLDYCKEVVSELKAAGLRVELDEDAQTINKKVRDAQMEQVNYILIVGDQEVENKTVNVRTRENEQLGEKSVADLKADLVEKVKGRINK